MTVEEVEFAVVGAGVVGLSAAWSLARRGRQVTVLEQQTAGHERSGSKGAVRIFRLGYPDPLYVQMARSAERLWHEVEAESGVALLVPTGQLSFGPELGPLAAALRATGAPFEELPAAEVARRFPALAVRGPAVFEPRSGVLLADRCLAALAGRSGVRLVEGARVGQIRERADAVEVHAGDVVLAASVVVLCPGAWSAGLLRSVGITVALVTTLKQVVYLRAPPGDAPAPIFIEHGGSSTYGLPVPGTDRYKLAFHGPGPPADPDRTDLSPDPPAIDALLAVARRLLPTFGTEPVATERCFYDSTPDEDFLLERRGRVVVGCGTSGHGFKFGPLLGTVLADLALGEHPSIALERFRSTRPALAAQA